MTIAQTLTVLRISENFVSPLPRRTPLQTGI